MYRARITRITTRDALGHVMRITVHQCTKQNNRRFERNLMDHVVMVNETSVADFFEKY